MIEDIKNNIEMEAKVIGELSTFIDKLEYSRPSERRLLLQAINSLKSRIKLINNSIPGLLKDVSLARKLPTNIEKKSVLQISNVPLGTSKEFMVSIKIKDRKKFLKELNITEAIIRRLKKGKVVKEDKIIEFKNSNKMIDIFYSGDLPTGN